MAITYDAIQTVTVGSGGASSIQFTSIPQTYTDLVLFTSLRTNNSASNYGEQVNLQINGSTSSFTGVRLEGFATTAQGSIETDGRFGRANNATQTASTFSNIMIYINNYTRSGNKSWYADAVTETNSTLYNEMYLYSWNWANSSAITSLTIVGTESGSNFVQHSSATLFGILKA